MKLLRKIKGFTLIELMIVIMIIGILAAIAIPSFLSYREKYRAEKEKTTQIEETVKVENNKLEPLN